MQVTTALTSAGSAYATGLSRTSARSARLTARGLAIRCIVEHGCAGVFANERLDPRLRREDGP